MKMTPGNEERDLLEKIREKLTAIVVEIETLEELGGSEEELPDGVYRPCLQCSKPNRKLTRGLCGKCYSRTKSAVKRGVISLDEVIAKGLWLTEAQRTGRKMKAPTKLDELIYRRVGVEPPTVQGDGTGKPPGSESDQHAEHKEAKDDSEIEKKRGLLTRHRVGPPKPPKKPKKK